jgi:hypothetical protein
LIEYLGTLWLGRVATAGSAEQPHVVPVSFRYNAEQNSLAIGGHAFATRKKYRDVLANPASPSWSTTSHVLSCLMGLSQPAGAHMRSDVRPPAFVFGDPKPSFSAWRTSC